MHFLISRLAYKAYFQFSLEEMVNNNDNNAKYIIDIKTQAVSVINRLVIEDADAILSYLAASGFRRC